MATPTVQGRDTQVSSTTNDVTWTIPFPVGWDTNLEGDVIYVFISSDGNPTISTSSTGWTIISQTASATTVKGAIARYVVSADDEVIPDLVIDTDAAEQFTSVALWLRSSTGAISHSFASAFGLSVNPDAPSIGNPTGGSLDALAIASRHTDLNEASSVQPTGYGNIQQRLAGGSGGATTETAEKSVTLGVGGTEDPSAWTIPNSRRWVSYTTLVYETTGGTSGQVKVWNGSAQVLRPVKVWNGSAWVTKPVKVWNGSAWVAT